MSQLLDRSNLAQSEAYRDLLNVLDWTEGFGLVFVSCTPAQEPQIIEHIQKDLPQKRAEHLTFNTEIKTLYSQVEALRQDHDFQILFISGLAKSFEPYIRPGVGGQGDYYKLDTVPPILSHLNLKRERFREAFPIRFVFFLPPFGIKYFIQRAQDFFDWRSGYVEFPTAEFDHTIQSSLSLDPNSDPERFFTEGNRLFYAEQYEEAIVSFDQALSLKPDLHEAWNNRGIALRRLGRHEEAIVSYDQALSLKLDYHEAWFMRGIALSSLGRYEEAIVSYDQALSLKPDDHETWNDRGVALSSLGRYEEAIVNFDKTLALKPDYYTAWHNRVIDLVHLGRYKEAIDSYDRAFQIKPDDYDYNYAYWHNKGILLYQLDRYLESFQCFAKVSEIQPKNQNAWNSQGYLLLAAQAYPSVPVFGKPLLIHQPELKQDVSTTLTLDLETYQQALIYFEKAIELNPQFILALANQSFPAYYLQQYALALESCNKALEFDPENQEAMNDVIYSNRGCILLQLNDPNAALESFTMALKFDPNLCEAWIGKGNTLKNLGRNEEAIVSFEEALKLKPDDPSTLYNKSCCYALQNQLEPALNHLQQVIKLDSKYRELARSDSDFDNIRRDDRFQALINVTE